MAPRTSRSSRPPLDYAGAENWTDLVPHRPGVLILDIIVLASTTWCGSSGSRACRASSCAICDDRRGMDGEVRRGGLLARHVGRLRVRHDRPSASAIRRRRRRRGPTTSISPPASAPCSRSRRCRSGHNPADYETPPHLRRRRRMASACRSPCSIARAPSSTAPPLPCSMATAPTACPCRRASRCRGPVAGRSRLVYAIAHIRGGMEKGYAWYKNGRREYKANTFTDFIAARRNADRAGDTPRSSGSSPRVARPVAC